MTPNPFDEINESLAALQRLVAAQAEELRLLREAQPVREYLTLEDYARIVGVSPDWFKIRPYLRPNYGRSDRPGKIPAWRLATINEWLSIPLSERERAWATIPGKQKAALMGAA